MLNFLKKSKTAPAELAPQMTLWQRRALEFPSAPGLIPHATYDEMERDAMVQTALSVKRMAVISTPWRLEPAGPVTDFVLECFDRMEGSPMSILTQAMDAFAHGWSVQELVYSGSKGRVWLQAVRPKDPSLFGLKVDEFGRLGSLLLRIPGGVDRALDPAKFVVCLHRASLRHPKGRSDLDAAHRHWRAKHNLLSAWQLHLERFAMPTVLGRYERGLPADEQAAILAALKDLQNSTAVIYPREVDVSTIGGDRGPSTGFQEAIEFHNREIARSILGQTLTTDEGRRVGSLALGRVHLQVMMLQVNAMRRSLSDAVMTEQVIRPLVRLNFGDVAFPRFILDETPLESFVTGQI